MAFYQEILYCIVPNPSLLGDNTCHNFGKYNTAGCKSDNGDCLDFNKNYPRCKAEYPILLGDGICNGGHYNSLECGYDGGDCEEFNVNYPNCSVDNPGLIGNGICDADSEYNTTECHNDGGDCLDFWGRHPNCTVGSPDLIGDGICDNFGIYNTAECAFDNGDCDRFNAKYHNCTAEFPESIGDGLCDGDVYNTLECGFDIGDCDEYNNKFPNCEAPFPHYLGNDYCDGDVYNTLECGWDGGDCDEYNNKFPNCEAPVPLYLGDGECDGGVYNTSDCGWDGGDCEEKFPNCTVASLRLIGNGKCDGGYYNSPECGWDGGDCDEFNKYPNCEVPLPSLIADGSCDDSAYNTEECGWDGGDCYIFNNYPLCEVPHPPYFADGSCDGGAYNTEECGWDGGDCEELNKKIPNFKNCKAPVISALGDGFCDDSVYNSPECGWDFGDCDEFNIKYPNCTARTPSYIGDLFCDGGAYNTAECGFDEGDCENFNSKYPNCFGVEIQELGDGICQHNTAGCNYDDGDCTRFNTLYPNCTADDPTLVGNGYCQEEYNTLECQNDGGDCINNETSIIFVNGEKISIENYKNDTKIYAIIQTLSSVVSLIASIAIICIIYRSFDKLSVPLHRLLLGLCIADILLSCAQSFSTLPAPNLFDVIWNAQGNKGSCQTQGFFIFFGSIAAPLYNCSLCFYSLIMVTYKKTRNVNRYVVEKIERYLHLVPVVVPLIGATTILSMNAFNPNMTYCFIGADPTCTGLECNSNGNVEVLFTVFSAGPYVFLPCVIIVTMVMMYRSVLKHEKNLGAYGNIGLIRASVLRASSRPDLRGSVTTGRISSLRTLLFRSSTLASGRPSMVRSNSAREQKRAIMNKALSYSVAFIFTYLFPMIISIRTLIGLESGSVLSILARIFFPLQGFFNFIVFIQPKILFAKKSSRENITWYRAFVKALKSRGRPRRRGATKFERKRKQKVAVSQRVRAWVSGIVSNKMMKKKSEAISSTEVSNKNIETNAVKE